MLNLSSKVAPWLVILLWLGLSPLWIEKGSLWIDEAGSAVRIFDESPLDVWTQLRHEGGSNLHLPFYHFYLWGSSKVFGQDEVGLRLANLPWMLLGFVLLVFHSPGSPGDSSRAVWLALFLTTSPFLMSYSNEVRPYAMQFGLAAMAFVGMARMLTDSKSIFWAWLMATGTFSLAWTTVYGLAWWLINLGFLLANRRQPECDRRLKIIFAFLAGGGVSALIFHAWAVSQGASASAVGQTGWKSLGYAVCEWTGAAGFLPGRSALRMGDWPGWEGFVFPGLTAALCLLLLIQGSVSASKGSPIKIFPAIWMAPAVGIAVSGILRNFRIVGRHFMPVSPSFFWLLSFGPGPKARFPLLRGAALVLIALWVWSDVRLATRPEHRKDDYRGAVNYLFENIQAGQVLWWAADQAAARFYNLQNYTYVGNVDRETLSLLPKPDWIAVSKPDIYDPSGALADFIAQFGATQATVFPSFVIYRSPNNLHP